MSQRRRKSAEELRTLPIFNPQPRIRRQRIAKPFDPFKRVQKSLTMEEKTRIIYTYFGSLIRFDRPVISKLGTAKKLRMAFSTVHQNIKRFVMNGHNFQMLMRKKQSFVKIPARLKRKLLQGKLLQEWGPFSIAERVRIISRV